MQFRTEITPPKAAQLINLSDSILSVGSCFSDEVGRLLEINKFDICINPYGTIYNPISLFDVLTKTANNEVVDTNQFIESQGTYFSYQFHSKIWGKTSADLKQKASICLQTTSEFLKSTKWLLITLGTALVYRSKDTGQIVANCHKVPADRFDKSLLTVEEIERNFDHMVASLPHDTQILLTVSPVRHLRDTLELNNVSKSTLRIFTHRAAHRHDRVHYFPSYELLIDDLRDYRFYSDDLLHPSKSAVDYIWEKFSKTMIDNETQAFVKKWAGISKRLQHRPFHPSSDKYKEFLFETKRKLEEIQESVNVQKEIDMIELQLNEIN